MKTFDSVKTRIFLVGCPRSGTTLLQSLLTAHSQITSFPESHFFRHLIPIYDRKRYWLGIASKQAKPRLEQFLQEIKREDLLALLPRFVLFQFQYIQVFIKILDTIAQEQGKSIWIEKTPDHVCNIDYIEKHLQEVKFIHIIRNGTDAVASLYEVSHNYPQNWHGEWSIDRCIRKWRENVQISLDHQHKPNHILVQYEQLVENPALILSKICDFLAIEFEETMLGDYRKNAQNIVLENEPWKRAIANKIQNKNGQKFQQLFNSEQQSYISEKLSELMAKLES